MEEENKKENWLTGNKYTKFQKGWIIGLLVLLCFSVIMTLIQGIRIMNRKDQPEQVVEKTPEPEKLDDLQETPETVLVKEQTETVLQMTEPAGREYLDETLFLGDSNTVRFMYFVDEDGKTYTSTQNTIAVVGMGVGAMDSLECMQFSSGTYTMVGAVRLMQPRRIIVTMGTNNLHGISTNTKTFIETYTDRLKKIQNAYAYADIIVNAIPPVTENCSYENVYIEQINAYNRALMKMCDDNHWKFLNSIEDLVNEDGYAVPSYMSADGLHLSEDGMRVLFNYIKNHAWNDEDKRPTPLKDIPEIIGPLTNLYQRDPLSNEEYQPEVLDPSLEVTVTPEPVKEETEEKTEEEVQEEETTKQEAQTPAPEKEAEAAPEVTEETPPEEAQVTEETPAQTPEDTSSQEEAPAEEQSEPVQEEPAPVEETTDNSEQEEG